nr:hypothetical protein [Micromonospora sp. DSM 115978]
MTNERGSGTMQSTQSQTSQSHTTPRRPMPAHVIVERALALSKADHAVVIAGESSTVNLRWANNTLTTNGAARD